MQSLSLTICGATGVASNQQLFPRARYFFLKYRPALTQTGSAATLAKMPLRWIRAKLSRRKPEQLPEVYRLAHQAYALLQAEEYDRARVPLLKAIASRADIRDPALVTYLLNALESTWLLTDQYEDAIAFFSAHVAAYPKEADAYQGRAASLWYSGRFQDAIQDYNRALQLNPNDVLALSGRGQVLAEAGEHSKALEDLDLALRALQATTSPDSRAWRTQIEAFTRNGKGLALAGADDIGSAMKQFDQSIALSPENAWVYHNRAQMHELTGDLVKAKTDYQRSLASMKPRLSPNRMKHAQARLRELSNAS